MTTAPATQTRVTPKPPQVVVAPRTLVTLVAVTLGSVLLLGLLYATREILIQLVIAVVLAMALEPFVQALERRGAPRGRAVGITFTLAALGVAAFAYLLIPPLVDEVTSFGHHAPELLAKLTKGHGKLVTRSEEHTSELQSHSDIVCRLLLEKKKNKLHCRIPNDQSTA